MEKVRKVGT